MKKQDKEHTAFIMPHGVYCYNTMPFDLKNAGATYQRCMRIASKTKSARIVEVYVNDIVIKTKKADTLLDDLHQTFINLNKYDIKLNPTKCSFGVPTRELLGYLISERGIEANLVKIRAILRLTQPTWLRHVQQLAGKVAALSRFISKLGEKALPFYQLL
jgi:hypothetical protein